ncbi:GlcG/HbpS family heme-binding protein [Pokkaliibacter sp. CJK22405]|uniref:GlcG/HbpS family heme-binding protein n=1 Tax=Pokkaliibacter sp. CJK22405 TaxID=3384615 RepID=UPI0039850311
MTDTGTYLIPTAQLSLQAAENLLARSLAGAREAGFPVAVAVVDSGGALRAFARSDDAPFLTAQVAMDKAWTAASFGFSTAEWNDYMANPRVAPLANTPRMMPVAGGIALRRHGQIIGAIGISGGSYTQDDELARSAIAALGLAE